MSTSITLSVKPKTNLALSTVGTAIAISAILLLGGCAKNLKVDLSEVPAGISAQRTSYYSEDSTLTLDSYTLIVPGTVKEVDYDARMDAVLLAYGADNNKSSKGTLVLYDLGENRALWAAKSNASSFLVGNEATIVQGYGKSHIRSAKTGEYLRDAEAGLTMSEGITLVLNKDMFASIDLLTGAIHWQRAGSKWRGFRQDFQYDEWMYVVANGLHGFKIESGKGWDREVSVDHEGVTEAVAKEAALSCLAALGGYYRYGGNTHAKVYHNAHSAPLLIDDRLYFAARSNIYCLNPETGETLWDAVLRRDYGGLDLYEAGNSVALVGTGWKYVDYSIQRDNTPSVAIYDKMTGEQGAFFELPEPSVTTGFFWLENGALLLTPTHIYRLGHDLSTLGISESVSEYGSFLRFLSVDEQVAIIRTSLGVISMDPTTLQVNWFTALGQAPFYESKTNFAGNWKEGAKWVLDAAVERNRSKYYTGLHWLSTHTGNIQAVDIDNRAEVLLETNLSCDNFEFSHDAAILTDSSSTIILPFDQISRVPPPAEVMDAEDTMEDTPEQSVEENVTPQEDSQESPDDEQAPVDTITVPVEEDEAQE